MYKYAQIDLDTGRCISVSFLSGEVDAAHMIPLFEMQEQSEPGEPDGDGNPTTVTVRVPVILEIEVSPGDTWDGTAWTPAPPPDTLPTGPTLEDQIADLQAKNAALEQQLAQTNADLTAVLEMILIP